MTHTHDLFEKKARAGDGHFAIAFALMRLADANESIAKELAHVSNYQSIEMLDVTIGNKLAGIGEALTTAADTIADAMAGDATGG